MSVLHLNKELSVSVTELVKEKSFLATNGERSVILRQSDMGKVTEN